LTPNKRNCVLYIQSEKQVLHFLKDCASKAAKVLKMKKDGAYKEIDSWKGSSKIIDYFRRTIAAQLLPE